jgi:hypothetical protein
MSNRMLNMSVAAVLAAGTAALSASVLPTAATAMPLSGALAIKDAAGSDVQQVWGRGFWWGFGPGFVGGAIVGSAVAAPYYYRPYPYYYYGPPAAYGPGYPAPGYAGAPGYCATRFKSWDPATGTYLGHDGLRHPCP